ncbi:MAG: hypothetical protein II715_03680 [Clostridia bacterium]|nr:hypothetical protein [Clostridia bacterium]
MRVINESKLDELESFIKEYAHDNNGKMPVFSEIMDRMSMTKSVAYRYLSVLRDRNRILYSGKGTLQIPEQSDYFRQYRSVKVPIYGNVICGTPEEEEQYNDGYLAIPEEWVDGECFLLRAFGDSMRGAGVDEGDLVLVKRYEGDGRDLNGKVVVALTEDGNTLKRLFWDGDRPRLHPENPAYSDFLPERLMLQGVALRAIKEIE